MSEHRLDELCEILDSKRVPLSAMQRAKRQGPYPYYGAQSIIDYVDDYLLDGKYLLVAEDGANLVTRTQDIANIVSGKIWVNNHAHILGYNGKCPLELLGFILNHSNISPYVTGCAQPKLNQDNLRRIPINLPEKVDAVSSILSSLDDKIAVNRRICENLEAQAQALFKHWFIDFAPFKNGKFVESELGMIPEGWRVGSLGEICNYSNKKIAVSQLTNTSYYSTENMLPNKAGAMKASSLPQVEMTTGCLPYDVLVSNIRPYFKKIIRVETTCGCSTDVLCFHPVDTKYMSYMYRVLYDDSFFAYVMAGSKGTKMPRGDKQQIMKYPIVIPTNFVLEKYSNLVEPMFELISSSNKEIIILSTLRDTLLPKLMSGQIKV
jgi:type I restriction enzyme S subunit